MVKYSPLPAVRMTEQDKLYRRRNEMNVLGMVGEQNVEAWGGAVTCGLTQQQVADKPSKSAIASVEKFTRQLTTLIARYFLSVFGANCQLSLFQRFV